MLDNLKYKIIIWFYGTTIYQKIMYWYYKRKDRKSIDKNGWYSKNREEFIGYDRNAPCSLFDGFSEREYNLRKR